MTDSAKRTSMVSNVLAIVGFIILFIIIVWGLLHLASISGGWFSSLFQKKNDTKITVTAPSSVQSGSPMTLSWKYSTSDKGSYALLYPCGASIALFVPRADSTFATVRCGAAYTLGNASSSVTLIPSSSATSSIRIPLTVLFIIPSAAGTQAQGSAGVTITPRLSVQPGVPVATTTPTTKPTPTTQKPAPVDGPADLAVSIVSSGIDAYGNGAVVFDIANIGGSSSGSYYFYAQLPTAQPYTYSSPAQAPLAPGSHVLNTLNFTAGVSGSFTVSVSGGNDSNLGNNSASSYLSGPAYQNQYSQYPQYQY